MTDDRGSSADEACLAALFQTLATRGLEVRTAPADREARSRDASLYRGQPRAVVCFPEAVRERMSGAEREALFHEIVRGAQRCGAPVTFVGSRTSVAGQAVSRNGLLVDLSNFARPGQLALQPEPYVETEPGVILDDLNAYLKALPTSESGDKAEVSPGTDGATPVYEHALDLSSSYMASVGGAIMNNGGGILATKYGSACENVLDLRVLLPDGRCLWTSAIREQGDYATLYHDLLDLLLQAGPQTILDAQPQVRKNASGYNLRRLAQQARDGLPLDITKLFVGSEGTLGTLLGARVRVRPVARPRETALIFFDNLATLSQAVNEIMQIRVDGALIVPRTLEVISGTIFDIFERAESALSEDIRSAVLAACLPPQGLSAAQGGALLVEYDDPPEIADAARAQLRAVCEPLLPAGVPSFDGAVGAFRAFADARQRANLWALRRHIVEILNTYADARPDKRFAPPVIEDIGVPIGQLGDTIAFVQAELARHELPSAIFGHAGDGNLHVRPLLLREQMDVARQLMDSVYPEVVKRGGTITAEHGDGHLRTPFLHVQYKDQEVTALFKRIKELFDPSYTFNPGVKVPHADWPDRGPQDLEALGFSPTGGGRRAPHGGEDVLPR
jgi:FAD/FMN-containing dehydrogenase